VDSEAPHWPALLSRNRTLVRFAGYGAQGEFIMARIPYATPGECDALMREVRLPVDAVPTNSLRMLAHAPAIGGAVLRLIHTILANADLDLGLRELAILRVTQRDQTRYAWTQHAAIAKAIGVGESQIAALERGRIPAELFSSRERALLVFVDEALDLPRVTDETFARAQEEFTARELVELLLTIGYFRMIGRLLTTLDLEVERASWH
jgi:4-carboxymuconolactone decarboxylase